MKTKSNPTVSHQLKLVGVVSWTWVGLGFDNTVEAFSYLPALSSSFPFSYSFITRSTWYFCCSSIRFTIYSNWFTMSLAPPPFYYNFITRLTWYFCCLSIWLTIYSNWFTMSPCSCRSTSFYRTGITM